jgi:hypothetical protein
MRVLSIICLLVSLLLVGSASATVVGAGSMSWSVQVPQDYTNSYHAGSLNNDFSQRLYLTNTGTNVYEGALSDGLNSISARVNTPTAGDISGEVTAQSNSPGSTASAGLDVVSSFMYYGELTGLSYSYSFSGQKDSFGDNLIFMIQTEVEGFNGTEWVRLYSDYTGNPLPVRFVVDDYGFFSTEPGASFSYPDIDFSGYDQFNVRLDFMIFADDYLPQDAVPIPPSVLLLGSGLLGLGGWRRFRKG